MAVGGADRYGRRGDRAPLARHAAYVYRLLRRVRDHAQARGDGSVSPAVAAEALDMLEVDHCGFDPMDRPLPRALIEKLNGGPAGLDSLAAAMGEERGTIEDVLEPFLVQQGYLLRANRGRLAAPLAWRHVGLTPSAGTERLAALADAPSVAPPPEPAPPGHRESTWLRGQPVHQAGEVVGPARGGRLRRAVP